MNATATYNSEHSWSRQTSRCSSVETVLSIQGRETDVARDTSDTEAYDEDLEYEPVSEPEEEAPLTCDDTDISDNEIISTKVIEVSVIEDNKDQLADSEPTDSQESDSEIDFHDYWQCAQCHADNNNPLFRYCEKCFKSRKHFFPPRPKRKVKRKPAKHDVPLTLSQDSGIASLGQLSQNIRDSQEFTQTPGTLSQEFHGLSQSTLSQSQEFQGLSQSTLPQSQEFQGLSQSSLLQSQEFQDLSQSTLPQSQEFLGPSQSTLPQSQEFQSLSQSTLPRSQELSQTQEIHELSQPTLSQEFPENPSTSDKPKSLKRTRSKRSQSADRNAKRSKGDSDSEGDTIHTVQGLVKTISDPSITIEEPLKVTKKVLANSLKNIVQENDNNMCFICFTEPKSGVFVHGRIAHICCCYKCAMKVWSTAKRCPICNRKVSNVLKAVIT